MRFGTNWSQRRFPAWRDFYVDYSRLKAIVNTKPTLQGWSIFPPSHRPPDLKSAVNHEVEVVDRFIRMQNHNLETYFKAFITHWGIEIGLTGPPELQGVSVLELKDLQISLLECADLVMKCHEYAKINADALSRIFDKTTALYSVEHLSDINVLFRLNHHDLLSQLTQWLKRLNHSLQLVQEAIQNRDEDKWVRSLLLEKAGMPRFPPETTQCLRDDDHMRLEHALNNLYPVFSEEKQSVMARLVQVATVHQAFSCRDVILPLLRATAGTNTIPMYNNYLHIIVQQIAHSKSVTDGFSAAAAFRQVLNLLHNTQLYLLQAQDDLGRSPLHYAAQLGLDGVCREIITAIGDVDPYAVEKRDRFLDASCRTPFDYAVQHGHTAVVDVLLDGPSSRILGAGPVPRSPMNYLYVAISSGFTDIASRLIQAHWGLRFVSRSGQNILHIASEQGISALVPSLLGLGMDVNAIDNARGWTPLITACVHGDANIVQALLDAGADPSIADTRGWLGKDYAAYRGNMEVSNCIKARGSPILSPKPTRLRQDNAVLPPRSPADSVIFIYLGTLDLFRKEAAVDITAYRQHIFPVHIPDTSLDLSISLVGGSGQEHSVSLLVLTEASDRPWCFTTTEPDSAAVLFKLKSSLNKDLIGTAIALLGSLKKGLGPDRESLIRDFTIPLVNDKVGHVGNITFTFVVAKPYKLKQLPSTTQTLELETSSIVGGHRGNGQNADTSQLQIGENTLQSFQTAIDQKADLVEFDVQLTKDNVPVIYHDFLFAEKGSDVPIHAVTLEQFTAVSDAQSTSTSMSGLPQRLLRDEREKPRGLSRKRTRSLCDLSDGDTTALIKQMKYTLNYPGYKANVRGYNIHEPFVKLEELFHNLPEEIAFDIELKYPMLFEANDFQMDTFAFELNHFLDTILSVIFAHAGQRRVILSTFSPEICMVLAVKQQCYPVLFLNDSSNCPTGDMRATSLQTAVRFAHRFGLAGVVVASQPFVASPGLVNFAREQAIYTATYGPLNDDATCAKIQAEAGVDLIITNKVKMVKHVLNERAESKLRPN